MTTIGVISDTHIKIGGKRQLPPIVFETFQDVDLIVHAGDANCAQVLTDLETLAPVLSVYGNNCDWDVLQVAPQFRIFQVEECRIGIAHGDVGARQSVRPFSGATGNNQAAANALSFFEDDFRRGEPLDCLIFGHSHWPLLQWREVAELPFWKPKKDAMLFDESIASTRGEAASLLLFNPGSACKKRRAPHHTCGLLRVDGTRLEAELVAC